jgi:predicted nucleic acid-binding protein
MTILVDTSVLIDHLRGHESARAALRQAIGEGQRLIGSVLTKVEVLAGVRPGEAAKTRRLLAVLHWVAVDEALAEDAGLLANRYLRSHPGVDLVDYVIAATAERERARLWTRNLKHFPMLPDLTAPY